MKLEKLPLSTDTDMDGLDSISQECMSRAIILKLLLQFY